MSDATKPRNPVQSPAAAAPNAEAGSDAALEHIRDALRGLRFGVVTIVVQDGVMIQIERTDRRRLR